MAAMRRELFGGHPLGRCVTEPPRPEVALHELRSGLSRIAAIDPIVYATDGAALAGCPEVSRVPPSRAGRRRAAPIAMRPCARVLEGGGLLTLLQAIPAPGRGGPGWRDLERANLLLLEGAWSAGTSSLRRAAPEIYRARTWLEGYDDAGIWWLELELPAASARAAGGLLAGVLAAALEGAREAGAVPRLEEILTARERASGVGLEGRLARLVQADRAAPEAGRPRAGPADGRALERWLLRFGDLTQALGLGALGAAALEKRRAGAQSHPVAAAQREIRT
jgi:hypothetical protein